MKNKLGRGRHLLKATELGPWALETLVLDIEMDTCHSLLSSRDDSGLQSLPGPLGGCLLRVTPHMISLLFSFSALSNLTSPLEQPHCRRSLSKKVIPSLGLHDTT